MTPLQLAKEHCANYQGNDVCLGMDFDHAGKHSGFRKKGACWLGSPIKRCPYFETAVMPQNVADWPPTKAQNFIEAVQKYKEAIGTPVQAVAAARTERVCPRCKTRLLEPEKQLCYVCADAKQKESQRERNKRYRKKQG